MNHVNLGGIFNVSVLYNASAYKSRKSSCYMWLLSTNLPSGVMNVSFYDIIIFISTLHRALSCEHVFLTGHDNELFRDVAVPLRYFYWSLEPSPV